jgi:hypothetical protein
MTILIISKIFLQHSVTFPVVDDVVIQIDAEDDGDNAAMIGTRLPLPLPPPIQERKHNYREDRRNGMWEEQLRKCRHVEDFVETYKMTESSFDKLVELLAPDLHVNERKSRNSTNKIQNFEDKDGMQSCHPGKDHSGSGKASQFHH